MKISPILVSLSMAKDSGDFAIMIQFSLKIIVQVHRNQYLKKMLSRLT